MKKTFSLLVIAAIAVGTFMVGCASAPKNVTNTSRLTHSTIKAAVSGWNDYLGKSYAKLGTNVVDQAQREDLIKQELKVRDAYRKYQAAQQTALSAAQAYLTVRSAAEQDRLSAALAESAKVGSELFGLIAKFVPQLNPSL